MLIHEEKVKTNRVAFVAKVKEICQRLDIDPNWLMQVMYFETAHTMSHTIENPHTKATGLIQFMPSTAISLGTTVTALKAMTNVQQLDWVHKYFTPHKGKMKSFVDVYFTVFFPIAVGKPDDWVLQTSTLSASRIASQNTGFDLNKDGKLTVAEIREVILRKVPKDWQEYFAGKKK